MNNNFAKSMTLYSWDVFKILLDYEINRSHRYPSSLTLLDMAVEPIPNSPDSLDAARANMILLLNSHLRLADIPAFFQEEYFILLPTTDELGGRAVCERLLSHIKGSFPTLQENPYTLSGRIGIATAIAGDINSSTQVLLQQARAALKSARSQKTKMYASYSSLK